MKKNNLLILMLLFVGFSCFGQIDGTEKMYINDDGYSRAITVDSLSDFYSPFLKDSVLQFRRQPLYTTKPAKRFWNKVYQSRYNDTVAQYTAIIFGDSRGNSFWRAGYGLKLQQALGGLTIVNGLTGQFGSAGDLLKIDNSIKTDTAYSKWVNGNVWQVSTTALEVQSVASNAYTEFTECHIFANSQVGTMYVLFDTDTIEVDLNTSDALVYLKLTSDGISKPTFKIWGSTDFTVPIIFRKNELKSGVAEILISEGGLRLEDAILSNDKLLFLCQKVSPDLFQFEFKDSEWETSLTSLADNVLDSIKNTCDVLIIGTTPIEDVTNDSLEREHNRFSELLSLEREYTYFDGYYIFESYDKLVELGWQGDGIHVTKTADLFGGDMILQKVFSMPQSGFLSNAVNDTYKPSYLASNTRIAAKNGTTGLEFIDDDSAINLDYTIKFPRYLSFKDENDDLEFRIGQSNSYPTQIPNYFLIKDKGHFTVENKAGIEYMSFRNSTSNYNGIGGRSLMLNKESAVTSSTSVQGFLFFDVSDSELKWRTNSITSEIAFKTGDLAPSNFLFPEMSYTPSSSSDLQSEVSSSAIWGTWTDVGYIYIKTDASTIKRVALTTF